MGALGGASTSVVVLVSALVRLCWLCAVFSVLCPEARGWTHSPPVSLSPAPSSWGVRVGNWHYCISSKS